MVKVKGKGGPAPRPIDWELFEELCSLQCTQSEIASCLKIHVDTLRDRAVEHYEEDYATINKMYSEGGKCSLRRHQFIMSKTNVAMAIWLGKQWLGQKDTYDTNDELVKKIFDKIDDKLRQKPIMIDDNTSLYPDRKVLL
jgi:hypothetical protein